MLLLMLIGGFHLIEHLTELSSEEGKVSNRPMLLPKTLCVYLQIMDQANKASCLVLVSLLRFDRVYFLGKRSIFE